MWIVVIEGLLLICLCPFLIEDILEVQHNCIIQETSYSNIDFFIFNLFFNFILKITHLDIYLQI